MTETVFHIPTKAKLNLSLQVVGKRADGYHLLHSIVAFCEVGDVLTATLADDLTLHLSGRFARALTVTEDNLVLRAASALREAMGVTRGARLELEKNLPVASGMGGGRGDAAATLHALNQLWECGLSDASLATLGATLGADVPVCVYGQTCLMEGVGEQITPMPDMLPPLYAVLVNPLMAVSTPAVFQGLQREEWSAPRFYRDSSHNGLQTSVFSASATHVPQSTLRCGSRNPTFSLHSEKLTTEPAAFSPLDFSAMRNDLQPSAIRLCPAIAEILAVLGESNALAARMSGSGATCFGLYASEAAAIMAASEMQASFPHYWVEWGAI
jgi:4-diphosphocytidyl-2-C-methyl-D-erythritol kinase